MIRCTLELVPAGGREPEHLGTIEIGNKIGRTLASNGLRGDYNYGLFKKRRGEDPWREGLIEDFPRLAYHPWNLIRPILEDVAKKNGGRI